MSRDTQWDDAMAEVRAIHQGACALMQQMVWDKGKGNGVGAVALSAKMYALAEASVMGPLNDPNTLEAK